MQTRGALRLPPALHADSRPSRSAEESARVPSGCRRASRQRGARRRRSAAAPAPANRSLPRRSWRSSSSSPGRPTPAWPTRPQRTRTARAALASTLWCVYSSQQKPPASQPPTPTSSRAPLLSARCCPRCCAGPGAGPRGPDTAEGAAPVRLQDRAPRRAGQPQRRAPCSQQPRAARAGHRRLAGARATA